MIVTISFKTMPGPKQITEFSARIDTEDFVDAVSQAVSIASVITTIEIQNIIVSKY